MSSVNNISSINKGSLNLIKSGAGSNKTNRSFSSYLNEPRSMDDIFEKAAKKYNVPANLLKAIGKAESNYNPRAVSRCGAQGVMQLMPATAASLGVNNAMDAEQNIMGGAKYISSLMKKYNGNTSLALAAYNAGMGNVSKYGGIPPFEETQNYVVKVTKYMKQGVNAGDATVTGANTAVPAAMPSTSIYYSSPVTEITEVTTDNVAETMDSIFSELDYLELLESFMNEMETSDNLQEDQ